MTETILELNDVHKHYQVGETIVKALNGVNLVVKKGDFIDITGPSGSGKSTLLHMMGALDIPTTGTVHFQNVDIQNYNDYELSMVRRKKIGFIFQAHNLIHTLNALENVLLPVLPDKDLKEEEKLERAIKLLKEVGLGERVFHSPGQLSGGERQRVAMARALINKPKIILADEPTGELDTTTSKEMMSIMRKINRIEKTTLVVVTHNLAMVDPKDTHYILTDGKIVDGRKHKN